MDRDALRITLNGRSCTGGNFKERTVDSRLEREVVEARIVGNREVNRELVGVTNVPAIVRFLPLPASRSARGHLP